MRWVKETLPPRARARWLLMTVRLSNNNLTGTDRTLVAVGTVRLESMFWTVRAAAPRSTTFSTSPGPSAVSAAGFAAADLAGAGFAAGLGGTGLAGTSSAAAGGTVASTCVGAAV